MLDKLFERYFRKKASPVKGSKKLLKWTKKELFSILESKRYLEKTKLKINGKTFSILKSKGYPQKSKFRINAAIFSILKSKGYL